MPPPLLLLLLLLPLVHSISLRGSNGATPDPPACGYPCNMGGCEFSSCINTPAHCGGGGCTFSSSVDPNCEGGGCEFYNCENPSCGGGGCTFMGCEGGDAPSTKEPEVWKPAETFERLSQDEKDALFNAPTLPNFAPPRRDTDPDNSLPDDPLDLAGGSSETTPPERPVAPHRDTNTAGGFNVERPDMFAKKYDTLPSEQVKTPTGVLDAAWTAGGRLPGREHIETTHRIEDLEAWADNLAALAEEKVGEARSEKDKTIQQADTLTSNVNFELRQEREANERQKHEAEKAAALALQWKEYSEQVRDQAELQSRDAEEAMKAAVEMRERESAIVAAERASLEQQKLEMLSHPDRPADPKDPDPPHEVPRDSTFTNKIMFVAVLSAALLSSYALFFTDVFVDLQAVKPPNTVTATIFLHAFLASFACIAALASTVAQDFGAILLCAPNGIWSNLLYGVKGCYVIALAANFVKAKFRIEWYCRLFQLLVAFVVADFKIQTMSHCAEDTLQVSGLGFSRTALPFYVCWILYAASMCVELKVVETKRYYEGEDSETDIEGGSEKDKDAEGLKRDAELETLLYSFLSFEFDFGSITEGLAIRDSKKDEDVGEEAVTINDDEFDDKERGEMKASERSAKRRR